MDEMVKTVRDSNLAPSGVYPKAAALAAAVALPDVFILHMTKAQTAVILVRGGVTRIVHRLELPQDINEQAEVIAMGVGQVAGYHRSQRPDDDVAELPVVVTGGVEEVKELVDRLAATLDRPILPFEPNVEYPEGFDPAEYAANIGLYLAHRSRESAKVISTQNVLTERHGPKKLPMAATAVFIGLLGLGFLAFTTSSGNNSKMALFTSVERNHSPWIARFTASSPRSRFNLALPGVRMVSELIPSPIRWCIPVGPTAMRCCVTVGQPRRAF